MASPPGACRWGDGDKRNNLLCVLTPGGGHNLGCVAPSPAGLTYGQGSTRGNNGLAPPPPLPVSIRAAPALALFSCPQGEPPVHGDSLALVVNWALVHLALPEGLPLALVTLEHGAQLAEPTRPVFPPPHPRQLHPLPHHRLAAALHRARADLPALRPVVRIIHPPVVV